MTLNRSSYKGAIDKQQINDFISTEEPKSKAIVGNAQGQLMDVFGGNNELKKQKEAVGGIQDLKQAIAKRILNSFNIVDSRVIGEAESLYIEALESIGQVKGLDKSMIGKKMKIEVERMFKSHSASPENSNYLGAFDKNLSQHTKIDDESIEGTKSKQILFDRNTFEIHKNNVPSSQIPCFYEKDNSGSVNYFSLNDVVNDILTFGNEVGFPKFETQIPQEYKKYFPSISRRIRFAFAKSIISKYRDYQETIMYGFDDYEKQGKRSEKQEGVSVEHIVEWHFRKYANEYPGYRVTVEKASIGEDQYGKVDLYVKLEDQKTGVNVKKLLQLTVNSDPEVIAKKKKAIERLKEGTDVDIELLNPKIARLSNSLQIWRKFGRPIGGVSKLLSNHDKNILKSEFNKIVENLKGKINKS